MLLQVYQGGEIEEEGMDQSLEVIARGIIN
jgi:hypothetical protein